MARKLINPTGAFSLLVSISFLALAASAGAAPKDAVSITEQEGKLRIEIGGELFSEYHYQNVTRPYLYPLLGPGNLPVTRNWPMKTTPDEEHDHPHHQSFWYAHGLVNGIDFWAEGKESGKTVHVKFTEVKSGDTGIIKSLNKLVAKDGTVVCTDERTLTIYNHKKDRLFDFAITIHASEGDVTLGDTKEGTMALRLAETMRQKGGKGKPSLGHIVNSEGVRDGATWGKRATWVDYYGPVEGKTVGVAIFDHPQNPRHPTWWHVRDYGLFAANPFGLHDFEKKPPGAGNLTIPKGQNLTFRYRFYIHSGDEKEAQVAAHFQDYAKSADKK